MKNILSYLIPATLSLLIATNVGSQDLKLKATDKLLSLKDKKINSLSSQVTSGVNSYVNNLGGVSAGDSLGGLKYIDFDLKLQEYYKPTFSIMSVYEKDKIHNYNEIKSHALAILVENKSGALARVVGMFSARGYNIDSLTVAKVAIDENISRITIVTTGTPPGVGMGKKPPLYLKSGDEMRLGIDYLGNQNQRVR